MCIFLLLLFSLILFFPSSVCEQDMMDDICQEQFMELSYLNGGQEHGARGRGGMPIRGRGVPPGGAHRCAHPWTCLMSNKDCWVANKDPVFTS